MLRPARSMDVKAMVDMLVDLHPRTIYAPYGDVDIDYARKLLAQMVHRHGGVHNGGTCVFVAEQPESEVICGFVAGALSPLYHVGTTLMAQDVFLIVRDGAPLGAGHRLLKSYIEWAEKSPKLAEIQLSHMDVLPGMQRVGNHYLKLGFEQCGSIYRRFPKATRVGLAA